MYYQKTGT